MSEKLYDLRFVEEMSGGNREFTRQLMMLFIETVPESLDNINRYYQSKQYEKLSAELHKLKSTVNTVKIPVLTEKIEDFENMCKSDTQNSSLREFVYEFNEVLPAVVEQMEEDLNYLEKE